MSPHIFILDSIQNAVGFRQPSNSQFKQNVVLGWVRGSRIHIGNGMS